MLPLDAPLTASFGLVLGTYAHAVGWPMVRGGSAAIADALATEIRSLGGEIAVGHEVRTLADLPGVAGRHRSTRPRRPWRPSPAIACRSAPAARYAGFRYGPGVFKVDWALDGPIPWTAPGLARAATVHLGGPLDEIVASEAAVAAGRRAASGRSRCSSSTSRGTTAARRQGKTTAWAYCHVPNGVDVDMTAAHRGAGRALRARLPRPHPRALGPRSGRDGGPRRELRRW